MTRKMNRDVIVLYTYILNFQCIKFISVISLITTCDLYLQIQYKLNTIKYFSEKNMMRWEFYTMAQSMSLNPDKLKLLIIKH